MDRIVRNLKGCIGRLSVERDTAQGRDYARLECEQGAAIVEAALSISVLVILIFGIIQMCMLAYCANFAAEAAREGTRYAVVRGQNSCTGFTAFPNCNLGPTTNGSNPVQTYIRGLGFPFANSMSSTTTWWSPTATTGNTWTVACTTLIDTSSSSILGSSGSQCNYPGHAVRVTVSYPFPIQIPFLPASTLTVRSTSMMVINN
jgi:hypothetical protein